MNHKRAFILNMNEQRNKAIILLRTQSATQGIFAAFHTSSHSGYEQILTVASPKHRLGLASILNRHHSGIACLFPLGEEMLGEIAQMFAMLME